MQAIYRKRGKDRDVTVVHVTTVTKFLYFLYRIISLTNNIKAIYNKNY